MQNMRLAMSKFCDEWRHGLNGVYYDIKHDYLVLLFWVGNRFFISAEFADCKLEGTSKPYPSTKKAGLIYIGNLYD